MLIVFTYKFVIIIIMNLATNPVPVWGRRLEFRQVHCIYIYIYIYIHVGDNAGITIQPNHSNVGVGGNGMEQGHLGASI